MDSEKKIYCPYCDSYHTDLVSYVYHCLLTGNAGKKIFVDGFDTELDKKREIPAEKRGPLAKLLKPPKEAAIAFPAATVALLAFLFSWIVVGSSFASKIGEQLYFYLTVAIVVGLIYPFYSTMEAIIKDIQRNYARYKKEKELWIKKYYCYDCEKVFIQANPNKGPRTKS
ncbi:MAG TPA: hypothetical protein PLO93_00725 [Candidatus Omnitrophota bacterium]|nr:hypothetical protein [Candidatus Omnitrophota bacterium]HQL40803.1 hypothetical protein [Candidatus Omnitrophota bacterium]